MATLETLRTLVAEAQRTVRAAEEVVRVSTRLLEDAERLERARTWKPNATMLRDFTRLSGPMSAMMQEVLLSAGERVHVRPSASFEPMVVTNTHGYQFEVAPVFVSMDVVEAG